MFFKSETFSCSVFLGASLPDDCQAEGANRQVDSVAPALPYWGSWVVAGLVAHNPALQDTLLSLAWGDLQRPQVGPEHCVLLGIGPTPIMHLLKCKGRGASILRHGHVVDGVPPPEDGRHVITPFELRIFSVIVLSEVSGTCVLSFLLTILRLTIN